MKFKRICCVVMAALMMISGMTVYATKASEIQSQKTQNEKAKENWDTVSCRLPKGTRKRITDKGMTVNGFINTVVLEKLDELENK